jgi:hypothetical protein
MTCPEHGGRLYGGPILFDCDSGGGHTVRAADLSHEYTPRQVAA